MRIVAAVAWGLVLLGLTTDSKAADENLLRVGELGDPARLVVRGTTAFDLETVKRALARDFDVLLAAHPSAPLSEYPPVLRQRAREGFLHAGFPNADAAVEYDAANRRFVVTIDEGPRYSAGDVRIEGARTINVQRLIQRLTKKYPPADARPVTLEESGGNAIFKWVDDEGNEVDLKDPVWTPGKPAAFDAPTNAHLRQLVEQALADLGYEFAAFNVDVVQASGGATADLIVDITSEGPPPTVREIEITGQRRNSREEILKLLNLRTGMLFTRHDRARIEHQLWQTGRFIKHRVTTLRIPSADGIKLSIELIEYEHAPPLSQAFSRQETVLLKCREWLRKCSDGEEDLVVTGSYEQQPFEAIIAPQHGLLIQFGKAENEHPKSPLSHVVVVADKAIGYLSSSNRCKLLMPASEVQVKAELALSLAEPEDGQSRLIMGFNAGFQTPKVHEPRVPFRFHMRLAPVAFLSLAYEKEAECTWNAGVLKIRGKQVEWQIDVQTGRLLNHTLFEEDDQTQLVQITFRRGAFEQRLADVEAGTARLPNEFDAARPISSVMAFCCREQFIELLEEHIEITGPPKSILTDPRVLTVLRKSLDRGLLRPVDEYFLQPKEDQQDEFDIPGSTPSAGGLTPQMLQLAAGHLLVPLADDLFPRGSWPWTLTRESGFVLADKSKYSNLELGKLYRAADNGPLCHLATAQLLEFVNPQFARLFAAQGLERLVLEDFRNDCRVLLNDEFLFGKCVIRAGEILRELDDADVALIGSLIVKEPELFVECVHVLRRNANQTVAQSLPAAMDRLWEIGLRQHIEWALRRLWTE